MLICPLKLIDCLISWSTGYWLVIRVTLATLFVGTKLKQEKGKGLHQNSNCSSWVFLFLMLSDHIWTEVTDMFTDDQLIQDSGSQMTMSRCDPDRSIMNQRAAVCFLAVGLLLSYKHAEWSSSSCWVFSCWSGRCVEMINEIKDKRLRTELDCIRRLFVFFHFFTLQNDSNQKTFQLHMSCFSGAEIQQLYQWFKNKECVQNNLWTNPNCVSLSDIYRVIQWSVIFIDLHQIGIKWHQNIS